MKYDVTIIGAGLAGLQCARLLSTSGLRVLLVDRKKSLDTSIHTTGIFVRRTLEDFQIPADCLGPAIRHVSLYSPWRRKLELTSEHDEFRVGKMGKLYHRYLDHCLQAGITWLPGTRYSGHVQLKQNHLLVKLSTTNAGRPISVVTRYLVGADGANSRVGRDLQLECNREWIVGVEDVFADVPLAGPPRLHCFLDPIMAPGYLAWIAHDGQETHVGVGGYAAMFDPIEALEKFKDSVRELVSFSTASFVERRGGRIPVGGVLRNISNPYGLLIGDTAGAVSPLTAGGLDPCMRLSSFAAQVIAEFLQTGDEKALNAFSGDLFRARFASRLWMRRFIAAVQRPALLEIACAGLRLPGVNRFARHIFFGRGSFPDVKGLSQPGLLREAL
jgi:flavin-dependent dehydrogenase